MIVARILSVSLVLAAVQAQVGTPCGSRAIAPEFCPFSSDDCCTQQQENPSLLFLPDGSGNRAPCWEARLIYDNATSSAYTDEQCLSFQNTIQNGGGVGCDPQCPTDAPVDLVSHANLETIDASSTFHLFC
jgi:hypothetical protein